MSKEVDVAAFVWPAYGFNDPRSDLFWPEGIGEWQTVRSSQSSTSNPRVGRRPTWGYVNEASPEVMRMQIDAAADYGVNVFIYDWYWYDGRPFLEACLNEGYLSAPNKDRVSFYLMWANHDATTTWDKRLSDRGEKTVWRGAVGRAEFEQLSLRLIRKYFTQPSYYRIEDKPVFMIYDLENLIRGLGGVAQAKSAFEWLRNECITSGLPGLHLQLALRADNRQVSTGVDNSATFYSPGVVNALNFDSLTHYQYVHFVQVPDADVIDFKEVVASLDDYWGTFRSSYEAPYIPHLSIGWDNSPRFAGKVGPIAKGNEPREFEFALEKAVQYLRKSAQLPALITLNSWNEWTETSYLQPDELHGFGYLQSVRRVICGSRIEP